MPTHQVVIRYSIHFNQHKNSKQHM